MGILCSFHACRDVFARKLPTKVNKTRSFAVKTWLGPKYVFSYLYFYREHLTPVFYVFDYNMKLSTF